MLMTTELICNKKIFGKIKIRVIKRRKNIQLLQNMLLEKTSTLS